jgi:hypothetical protein
MTEKVKLVQFTIYIRPDVLAGIKEAAKERSASAAELIRRAATRSYMRGRGKR